jgi:uncharacterized Zn-finger protein
MAVPRIFACTFPGCTFTGPSPGKVTEHESVHSTERPYTCGTCGVTFKLTKYLATHIRIKHQAPQKPPQSCPDCSYSSGNAGNFKRHLLCHAGLRPYSCVHPGCAYSARTKHALQNHEQLHLAETERRFKCADCGFCCAIYKTLERHVKRGECK